ncbi:MAG: hypothetical protein M1817_004765 [Caeruleum heppii]|nr:MAG: hypothetical protein M1817_004765 [Caeruleum heppii]
MSGIPTYTQSPISAAKASAITPQTASAPVQSSPLAPRSTAAVPTSTTTSRGESAYPSAKPGVAPGPAPTGPPQLPGQAEHLRPTPTRTAPTETQGHGPPPPQPGAAPHPSNLHQAAATSSTLPPPPKAGEMAKSAALQPSNPPAAATSSASQPYPPQMSYASPTSNLRSGASTATSSIPSIPMPNSNPTAIPFSQAPPPPPSSGQNPPANLAHPPGYIQNPFAAELTPAQRAAQEASQSHESGLPGFGGGIGGGGSNNTSTGVGARSRSNSVLHVDDPAEEGFWDTARKWVKVAGEKASEAEEEVWRRINPK